MSHAQGITYCLSTQPPRKCLPCMDFLSSTLLKERREEKVKKRGSVEGEQVGQARGHIWSCHAVPVASVTQGSK